LREFAVTSGTKGRADGSALFPQKENGRAVRKTGGP